MIKKMMHRTRSSNGAGSPGAQDESGSGEPAAEASAEPEVYEEVAKVVQAVRFVDADDLMQDPDSARSHIEEIQRSDSLGFSFGTKSRFSVGGTAKQAYEDFETTERRMSQERLQIMREDSHEKASRLEASESALAEALRRAEEEKARADRAAEEERKRAEVERRYASRPTSRPP